MLNKINVFKNTPRSFIKNVKRGMFNNNNDFSALLLTQKHNNLRVVSTPEFPVPYYQRLTRALPSTEQVTIDLQTVLEPVNDGTVIRVRHELAQSSEGLRVLDYADNRMKVSNYETKIDSVAKQCDIYSEELILFLDAAHEENCRILKSCDLADCLS
jgi:hypothetical protein